MQSLDGRTFTTRENTANGEVGSDTIFHYHQRETLVWAEYEGGAVVTGHLLGTIQEDGALLMRYHHLNRRGEVVAGTCRSRIETGPDGTLQLHEQWQWFTGDQSSGSSVVAETP